MVKSLTFLFVWCMLVACINTDSQIPNEKRLLITDPDYTNNQQMQRDIQILKATMSQLQASFNTLNNKITVQDKQIQSQTSVITAFQNSKSLFLMYVFTFLWYVILFLDSKYCHLNSQTNNEILQN